MTSDVTSRGRLLRHISDVDYGRWERTRTPSSQGHATIGPRPKVQNRPSSGAGDPRASSPAGRRGLASACRQIWAGAGTSRHNKDEERAERIRLIQLRIQARKRGISDYQRRYVGLVELNQKLRNAIEKEETGVHEEVKALLRKYEKFRGGISLLNSKFSEEFSGAGGELEETREYVNKQLADMKHKVAVLDKELQIKQKELAILANYKAKEYPVKVIAMNDLRKELETLTVTQGDEQEELETIIGAELAKMHDTREQVRTGIIADVTDDFLGQMHPTLQDMALQNLVMKKELEFHEKEVGMLVVSNQELERKVAALRRGRDTNVRMHVFPQLYPLKPRCTPDMDVNLDIPKQEWLPI